jgi:hypothetical protein
MLLDYMLASIISEPAELSAPAQRAHSIDLKKSPAMAALHEVCGAIMLLPVPMLWAALIALLLQADFFAK